MSAVHVTHSPAISPELSIELRLRFLEALLAPLTPPSSGAAGVDGEARLSIARHASIVQARLKDFVDRGGGGESVRHFVQTFNVNEPLLRPSLPEIASEEDESSSQTKIATILEAGSDIKHFERDLREIEALDQRGVIDPGKLPDHEKLQPILDEIIMLSRPLSAEYNALEARVSTLMTRYHTHINSLSEIFVSLNDVISTAESHLSNIEKATLNRLDVA